MLQLGTLGYKFNLFIFEANHFLSIVIVFILLHIFDPEVLRALKKLIDVLLLVNQVQLQLLLDRTGRIHTLFTSL